MQATRRQCRIIPCYSRPGPCQSTNGEPHYYDQMTECFFLPQLFLADIVVWDTEKNMKLFPFKVPKQGIAV